MTKRTDAVVEGAGHRDVRRVATFLAELSVGALLGAVFSVLADRAEALAKLRGGQL